MGVGCAQLPTLALLLGVRRDDHGASWQQEDPHRQRNAVP